MIKKEDTNQEPETEHPQTPEKPSKKTVNTQNKSHDLITLLGDAVSNDPSLTQGIRNLVSLPPFDPDPPAVQGKEFTPGVIGFRKTGGGNLSITIACGKAQVRYIALKKFIAMIETLHDPESATIMLQNFQDQDDMRTARGQILGRINAASSAVTIIQGVAGRIIRNPSDIALFDVYYIDRKDFTSFYLAAKAQISNADQLETMIAAYDGWKAFSVPLNPLNPYE